LVERAGILLSHVKRERIEPEFSSVDVTVRREKALDPLPGPGRALISASGSYLMSFAGRPIPNRMGKMIGRPRFLSRQPQPHEPVKFIVGT